MLEGFRFKKFRELYQAKNYNQGIVLIEKGLIVTNRLKYKRLVTRLLKIDIYKNNKKPYITFDLLNNFNEEYLQNLKDNYLIKYNKCLEYQNFIYASLILNVLLELVNLGYLNLNDIPNINDYHDYVLKQKQELEYIQKIKEDLDNNTSCVLTKPLAENRINILYQYIQEEPGLKSFKIKDDKGQHLVIHKLISEKIDFDKYKYKIQKAKSNENYQKALAYNFKLLNYNYIPSASIYANTGLLYLKLRNIKEAVKYLTIATYHPFENKFDFTKIIEDNLNFEFNDKKALALFKLEEFNEDDITKKYKNLIIQFNESKDNLDTFALNNNLSNEDKLIMKIIIARHYYANNFSKLAENLLRKIEKDLNNNSYITELIKETRKNKNFYRNKKAYQQILRLNI